MKMRYNLGLSVLLCAATPARGDHLENLAPLTGPSRNVALPVCVEFGPPPPAGTLWGTPAGHVPGQTVHVENNIHVLVQTFQPSGLFGFGQVQVPPVAFGNGQAARTSNVNLLFRFNNLGWIPTRVFFSFLDQGGFENLGVNNSPYFVGPLALAPAQVGGRIVQVSTFSVQGGIVGHVRIGGGKIKDFTVGGQGLWIDKVCVEP